MNHPPFEHLYIHVGVEKTGTTSIQRFMDENREMLEAHGYLYPRTFAVGKNTLLAALLAHDHRQNPHFRAAILRYGPDHRTFRTRVSAELRDEIQATPARRLVLSSEFLACQGDLEAVVRFCRDLAAEVTAVVYLREQASMIASLRSTAIKGGSTEELDAERFLSASRNSGGVRSRLDYREIVSALEAAFGDQLAVRTFDAARRERGGIVGNFLEVLDLDELVPPEATALANPSLSLAASRLLLAVNHRLPTFVEGERNRARDRLLRDLDVLDDRDVYGRYTLDDEVVTRIIDRYAESNEWVRQRHFPERASLFPHYVPGRPVVDDPDAPLELASRLLAHSYTTIHELTVSSRAESPQVVQPGIRPGAFARLLGRFAPNRGGPK